MKQRLLFLSTDNYDRGAIAAAFMPLIAGDQLEVEGVGTNPAQLNPMTVEVMRELGVNLSCNQGAEGSIDQTYDYLIRLSDEWQPACTSFPGARNVRHWSFDNPAAAAPLAPLDAYRLVRDEIAVRLCQFLIEEHQIIPAGLRSYSCQAGFCMDH